MKYLADSTFVIDSLSQQPHAQQLLPTLLREDLALSIVSHMELWDGVFGSRNPKQATRELCQFLRRVTILPLSHRVSLRTAQLRYEMRRRGLRIEHRMLDILIAGTAITHNLIMVTSDTDFDDIPGLTRLNPRTGRTT
jgi:predicted nucleic acid-binding protein